MHSAFACRQVRQGSWSPSLVHFVLRRLHLRHALEARVKDLTGAGVTAGTAAGSGGRLEVIGDHRVLLLSQSLASGR